MNHTDILRPFFWLIGAFFYKAPAGHWSTFFGVWAIRIVTFSILLRDYIIPWLFHKISKRIHVRTVSLRSVRGLYLRSGAFTCRVDRISYVFEGPFRVSVKVEGFILDVFRGKAKEKAKSRHRRTMTLVNFSDLQRFLRSVFSYVYTFADPWIRPVVRTIVLQSLRLAIQYLPTISQAISFDIYPCTIRLQGKQRAEVVFNKVHLKVSLLLKQEALAPLDSRKLPSRVLRPKSSFGVGAVRVMMADGFRRTLDRALDRVLANAELSLGLENATGVILGETDPPTTFMTLPGKVSVTAGAAFDPRAGKLKSYQTNATVDVDECTLLWAGLETLLKILKPHSPPAIVVPHADAQAPRSPSTRFTSFSPSSFLRSPPLSPMALPSNPLSGRLPTSPISPLREVFGGMFPRRHYQPCRRLQDLQPMGKVAFLKSFSIRIASIKLVVLDGSETHTAAVRDIAFGIDLSTAESNPLHKLHLGCGVRNNLDPDVYGAQFSIQETTLRRTMLHSDMVLLRVGAIRSNLITTQWPSPWLTALPFLGGDPNTALVALEIFMGGIDVTEHSPFLQKWADRLPQQKASTKPPPPTEGSPHRSLPRISVEFHSGPIGIRLLQGSSGDGVQAMELHNDGLVASAKSHFVFGYRPTLPGAAPLEFDTAPLVMHVDASASMSPTFLRVRHRSYEMHDDDDENDVEDDFAQSPALLSVEAILITAAGHALATIKEDCPAMAMVDTANGILEVLCTTELIYLELWNPVVISALRQVVQLLPSKDANNPELPVALPRPLLDKLPNGLTLTGSVGHVIAFVTSPDINPKENSDLSRGIAISAFGLVGAFSRMQSSYLFRCRQVADTAQERHKLRLPEELVMEAFSAGRSATPSALFRLGITSLSARSAVATPYSVDDPMIIERDHRETAKQELIRIHNFTTEVCISGQRLTERGISVQNDLCAVNILVPSIRASFALSHVYHLMLARQTVRILVPERPVSVSQTKRSSTLPMSYTLSLGIATMQAHIHLPKQRLALRIDGIQGEANLDRSVQFRWRRAVVWVPVPRRGHRPESHGPEKWQDLISLQSWTISPHFSAQPPSILVEGDSARIHIPFGYVLSALIQDLGVTVKAIKHLQKMTFASQYFAMGSPEAEGPKLIPRISIKIASLVAEAADDILESRLGLIWRTGLEAVKARLNREAAFNAKAAAIANEETLESSALVGQEYEFNAKHSVSVSEARHRLDNVHFVDWMLRMKRSKEEQSRADHVTGHRTWHTAPTKPPKVPDIVDAAPAQDCPPLVRVAIMNLLVNLSRPSFPIESLPAFLHSQGELPDNSTFTLLVPLHLNLALSSLRIALRDYPIPLADVPPQSDTTIATVEFDTDLVIAEEKGSESSVEWITCPVIKSQGGIYDCVELSLLIPKTIMPVKTYANANIQISAKHMTSFSWAVSYGPAMQDLMRVMDTISSAPRDSSPSLGFWDKLRMNLHWTIRASFTGEVRFFMKGLRDPHITTGNGAGFVLVWNGNPQLLIGRKNEEKELVQLTSESMLIAVPDLDSLSRANGSCPVFSPKMKTFKKVVAKLRSGVKFGVGIVLERSCGTECSTCSGDPFHRSCRFFNFHPHHHVVLEKKLGVPVRGGPDDSYAGFRSDFIHMSVSLTSSSDGTSYLPSSVHLTPKIFAHFYSWVSLFEGVLSLPIRQGSYYPQRAISPKFGRHIATLKYKISMHHIFVMHGYMDDSRETWIDGVTPWIGVKGMIDELQLDMHQRDQETVIPGTAKSSPKTIRRKLLYAAELVLNGLDLRAILATFPETAKRSIPVTASNERSNYRKRTDLPKTEPSSIWNDADDFIEVDWLSSSTPDIHILPVVACPRFTYFKRNSTVLESSPADHSKFGDEDTHCCVLGTEPSVPEIQISLAHERIKELNSHLLQHPSGPEYVALTEKISLLEQYAKQVEANTGSDPGIHSGARHYQMLSDTVSPDEWAEFDNVYQIHCPKIFLDSAVRDIMMQYYYSSRARRGFEYHMSTRAIKFLLDQAKAAVSTESQTNNVTKTNLTAAQAAAVALRKLLTGDEALQAADTEDPESDASSVLDPLNGWSGGVSLEKSHCCLLLKPQIVLQNHGEEGETCIVAAVQAKLQTYAVMDEANADDPVSGKVMSRSYTVLTGLQTFAPAQGYLSDGCVPLEVMIDFRCESDDFDRLVPQTDATFHYDKFNRLRLRNNLTSVTARVSTDSVNHPAINHLQDQTDLVEVDIPRFTVTANDHHFQTLSNIVTRLLLFSDAAHKTRLDKLETLLFTYDFTDLTSAAKVIVDLQTRVRTAMEAVYMADINPDPLTTEGHRELLNLRAHIFLLSEELNLIFDAIKLAQDRAVQDTGAEQQGKSALLLNASSKEISWKMLDENKELLAKLAVQDINFHWLSRQDSSTVNKLAVGNLLAFDGSPDAQWTEILSKYEDGGYHGSSHKKFLTSNWSILPPVGGITIYEAFELSFHPMRLQIDARVGTRIMEYVWPARRQRKAIESAGGEGDITPVETSYLNIPAPLESPGLSRTQSNLSPSSLTPPPLRRLGVSRSFTDLRSAVAEASPKFESLHRTRSTENLQVDGSGARRPKSRHGKAFKAGDAAEMKTRSSQKSFVLVRVSSLNIMLSVMKEDAFVCRDAHIKTRDLEYRNQTWSFEELVSQFIPSNGGGWMGWVKMAFNQPLVPVLPVARELISKTKWLASKGSKAITQGQNDDGQQARTPPPLRNWRPRKRPQTPTTQSGTPSVPVANDEVPERPPPLPPSEPGPDTGRSRQRVKSLFTRASSRSKSRKRSKPSGVSGI